MPGRDIDAYTVFFAPFDVHKHTRQNAMMLTHYVFWLHMLTEFKQVVVYLLVVFPYGQLIYEPVDLSDFLGTKRVQITEHTLNF